MSPGPTALRWSIFTVGDNLEDHERRPDRFREIVDHVAEAEALGFWAFFFAEHHFDPHGEIADPWLLVAAAAERTHGGTLRLGPMVTNLSFRDPVRVAEQARIANELSDGRIEIGVGSGNVPREHLAFGLGPDPIARKREAFDRNLPRFVGALGAGPIAAPAHPGGEVRIPISGWADPTPHVWVAVGRPEAASRYANAGHPIAVGPPFATMRGLADLAELVARVRADARDPARLRIAAAFPVYLGPEPEIAERALDRFLAGKHRDGAAHLPPAERSHASGTTAADLVRRRLAVIARPEEAAPAIAEIAATGITDLFAIPDFGGLSPRHVAASLRAIAAARAPPPLARSR